MKKSVEQLAEAAWSAYKKTLIEDHTLHVNHIIAFKAGFQSCLEQLAKEFDLNSFINEELETFGDAPTYKVVADAIETHYQAKLLLAEQKAAAAMESVEILNKEILSNCDKIDGLERKVAELENNVNEIANMKAKVLVELEKIEPEATVLRKQIQQLQSELESKNAEIAELRGSK